MGALISNIILCSQSLKQGLLLPGDNVHQQALVNMILYNRDSQRIFLLTLETDATDVCGSKIKLLT